MADQSALYRLEGICKSFGRVEALRDVDIDVQKGEILGLVGDNGAGKSTLIKILSGIYPPGVQKHITSYRNIFMGNEMVWPFGFMAKRRMRDITRRLLRESISIGLTDPDQTVGELSGGQKQAVAIVRAARLIFPSVGSRVLLASCATQRIRAAAPVFYFFSARSMKRLRMACAGS